MPGQRGNYSGAPSGGVTAASSGTDTSANPSMALWGQIEAELEGVSHRWIHVFEHFRDQPKTIPTTEAAFGTMQAYSSTGSTFGTDDEDGGPRKMVEATDNEGIAFRQGSQPFKIIQDAGELVFEFRIKKQEVALASNLFFGFLEEATLSTSIPIDTSGAMSDNNWFGFVSLEADPDAIVGQYKANGVTAVSVGSSVALVADEYIKLGGTFNREGTNVLQLYKNGEKMVGASKAIPSAAGTDFPNDVRVGWCIAAMGGAASSVNVVPDWVKVAQRRVTDAY